MRSCTQIPRPPLCLRKTPTPERTAAIAAIAAIVAIAFVASGCQEAPAGLRRPNAACVTGDGALWVSDFHHQRLLRVGFDGTVRAVGQQGLGDGDLWQVWSVVCDGEDVVVINEGIRDVDDPTTTWEIKRFSPSGGAVSRPLIADPEIGWAGAMARRLGGGWWVTDEEANALLITNESFVVQERLEAPEGGAPFDKPSFVQAIGDTVWVVEQYHHRIRALRAGRQILSFGEEGTGPGRLRFPSGLAVCPGRWVAVADFGNYRVQRFDLQGRYMDGFEPAGSGPDAPLQLMDITVDAACETLFLVDSKGDRVLATTPVGTVMRVFDGTGWR